FFLPFLISLLFLCHLFVHFNGKLLYLFLQRIFLFPDLIKVIRFDGFLQCFFCFFRFLFLFISYIITEIFNGLICCEYKLISLVAQICFFTAFLIFFGVFFSFFDHLIYFFI